MQIKAYCKLSNYINNSRAQVYWYKAAIFKIFQFADFGGSQFFMPYQSNLSYLPFWIPIKAAHVPQILVKHTLKISDKRTIQNAQIKFIFPMQELKGSHSSKGQQLGSSFKRKNELKS